MINKLNLVGSHFVRKGSTNDSDAVEDQWSDAREISNRNGTVFSLFNPAQIFLFFYLI